MEIKNVKARMFNHTIPNLSLVFGNRYKSGATANRNIIVVTIEGEGGIDGNCFVDGGSDEAKFIESSFKPLLLHKDAFDREKIWQELWYLRRFRGHNEKLLGVIDVALYDMAGKALGIPIRKILGGYRDRVKAYASSMDADEEPDGLSSPEAFADHAEQCVKQGFKAYKIHPWGDYRRDLEACKAVRERVGEDIVLMLDPFSAYNFEEALYVGRELEKLNFYWYEEPMNEYKIYAYVKLASELKIPILVTETIEGNLYSTVEYIIRGAGDMMRSDVRIKGGITPVKKTTSLCEAFGLKCEIHATGNPLMNAACLHILGSTMNCEYYELGLIHPIIGDIFNFGTKNNLHIIDHDGYIKIPSGPGLGVDIDWDYIEENTVKI